MKAWMKVCEGKDKKYIVSAKKVKQIEEILKLLNMPKGLKAGMPLYECTTGYQWLFYIAILCKIILKIALREIIYPIVVQAIQDIRKHAFIFQIRNRVLIAPNMVYKL